MSIAPIPAYSIELEFLDAENGVRTSSVRAFLAREQGDAIRSAVRFWYGRHKAMPEHFSALLCIKVFLCQIGPIDEMGKLETLTIWDVFEWKIDFPGTLEQYVELACNA